MPQRDSGKATRTTSNAATSRLRKVEVATDVSKADSTPYRRRVGGVANDGADLEMMPPGSVCRGVLCWIRLRATAVVVLVAHVNNTAGVPSMKLQRLHPQSYARTWILGVED